MKPVCCVCHKHISKKGHARKTTEQQVSHFQQLNKNITDSEIICSKCRQQFYHKDSQEIACHSSNKPNIKPTSLHNDKAGVKKETITLPIVTVGKTFKKCCVCLSVNGPFVNMPEKARMCVFVKQGLLVPVGCRCCPSHLDGNMLKTGLEIDKTRLRKTSSQLDATEIKWLFDQLRKMVSESEKKRIDFDNPNSLSSDEIYNLTGIKKDQFDFLVASVHSLKRSANRTTRTAIAMLLVKLKTGLSHRYLATLFGIGSIRTVSKIIQQAKKGLSECFVPSHIGFHHISREEIIENHTSNFATLLLSNFLSNSVICIMDGTYIYIQKSHKFKFQRRCFSMHKHRPLLKPMVVTSTDGYILSILGPYFADGKNNDASIVQHMMKSNDENMMKWYKKEDILILDRGFRDAQEFRHECGFQTESPAFLSKSEKQFSTEDANLSRLVTKIRWAVESVNARVKSWKYFDKVVPNVDILNLKDYLRLVCAICNKFKPPLINSIEEHCDIARQMLEKVHEPNHLQEKVQEDKTLSRKAREWVPLKDCKHYDNFPTLTDEYLRSLTFGVYQLKQAPNYADQHLANGNVDIFIHSISATIWQAKIQSRHTSCKQYFLWLEIDENNQVNPIQGWYYECKAGTRAVGCCVHIATVLWYMGIARHESYTAKPDKFSKSFENAAIEVETDTELDSE